MSQPRHCLIFKDQNSILEKIHYILYVLLEPRSNLGNNPRAPGVPFEEYYILDDKKYTELAEQDERIFNTQVYPY